VRVGTNGCGAEFELAGFAQQARGTFALQQCLLQQALVCFAAVGVAKENCPATSAMLKSRAINGFAIFRRSLVFLFGCGDFLHVFIGIFHEIFLAILAAHFDFLAFVGKNVRLHVAAADVFIGNNAFLQRVGLGLFLGLRIVGVHVQRAEAQGHSGK
jgi:hypothetical protein